MKRRAFVAGMAAVMVGPLAGMAQQAKVPRIGVLAWDHCPDDASVFGNALKEFGYIWGQRIHVLCRSGDEDYSRLSDAAAALAAQNVDLIVAFSHIAAYAARRATRATPIVMIASGDPVRTGLALSLARPGGNVTGLTYYATELIEKRLQLLKEMVPQVSRVAVLGNPDSDHVFGLYREDTARAAVALGLQTVSVDVRRPRELGGSFETIAQNGAQGLLVLTDPLLRAQAQRIVDLAAEYRLPALYWGPWFIKAGGLAAYSADYDYMVRRTTYYIDRILKGAQPAHLPIEQPSRFAFIINLKTARALNLTIPPSLLLRADQVIE
jgi:putative tryptophan/tyrosine transport system substrate-binding protein